MVRFEKIETMAKSKWQTNAFKKAYRFALAVREDRQKHEQIRRGNVFMTKVKSTGCGGRLRAALGVLGVVFSLAASQTKAAVLDNGIDPANLGKGDWIYILSTATSQHGG